MKNLIKIFLLLNYLTFAQSKDSVKQIRIYEISVCGKPQKIELIEFKNGKFEGSVKTTFTKRKNNLSESENINTQKQTNFIHSTNLDEKIVKTLMFELKENHIENIQICNNPFDPNCENESTTTLDGDYITFKIKTPNVEKSYQLDEIYPIKENKIESSEKRKQVQKLKRADRLHLPR